MTSGKPISWNTMLTLAICSFIAIPTIINAISSYGVSNPPRENTHDFIAECFIFLAIFALGICSRFAAEKVVRIVLGFLIVGIVASGFVPLASYAMSYAELPRNLWWQLLLLATFLLFTRQRFLGTTLALVVTLLAVDFSIPSRNPVSVVRSGGLAMTLDSPVLKFSGTKSTLESIVTEEIPVTYSTHLTSVRKDYGNFHNGTIWLAMPRWSKSTNIDITLPVYSNLSRRSQTKFSTKIRSGLQSSTDDGIQMTLLSEEGKPVVKIEGYDTSKFVYRIGSETDSNLEFGEQGGGDVVELHPFEFTGDTITISVYDRKELMKQAMHFRLKDIPTNWAQ